MSGPLYLSYSGGVLGGAALDALFLTGFGGVAVLYHDWFTDEDVFPAYIDGKLRIKEQVCHTDLEPFDVACATGDLRPNKTRISPP